VTCCPDVPKRDCSPEKVTDGRDLIPEIDNLDMMLRDKPQMALNWP
jgi:hypothetical protein